jgi:hypothetical protein|tara:strand:+ start:2901 stop:3470 length:570 start_codon:yes stop_codon:yes gene_type:complete
MKYLKSISVTVFALLLIVGVAKALTLSGTPKEIKELVGQEVPTEPSLGGAYFTTEAVNIGNTAVTTTPAVYLETGSASSTLSFNCDEASQIDLNLLVVASSTASKVQWEYSFSDDNAVFYFEDGRTVDSKVSVTHGQSALQHYWTPATTATTTKNITVTPVASKYCRVGFSVSGANAGILGSAILKKPY